MRSQHATAGTVPKTVSSDPKQVAARPLRRHLSGMKIHPTEALKAVRDLIAVAEKADDIGTVRCHLKVMATTIARALPAASERP